MWFGNKTDIHKRDTSYMNSNYNSDLVISWYKRASSLKSSPFLIVPPILFIVSIYLEHTETYTRYFIIFADVL